VFTAKINISLIINDTKNSISINARELSDFNDFEGLNFLRQIISKEIRDKSNRNKSKKRFLLYIFKNSCHKLFRKIEKSRMLIINSPAKQTMTNIKSSFCNILFLIIYTLSIQDFN
jgi:hypothetical protein